MILVKRGMCGVGPSFRVHIPGWPRAFSRMFVRNLLPFSYDQIHRAAERPSALGSSPFITHGFEDLLIVEL
jgi:hypothetical protein